MNSVLKSTVLFSALASALPPHHHPHGPPGSAGSNKSKVILDNDWSTAGFIPYLQALKAGWDVLGIIGDTSNSWALTTTLHGLATLERGDLASCIPVYKGSDYPLLQTPKLFQTWEELHGDLPWQGAFLPENATAEAAGFDPTSGDPERVVRAAYKEGFPNTTYVEDVSAAEFLVQQVRKYPGEVSIYSGGALTNIALAVRMDSNFAKNAKELIIMGGYIDVNVLMTTGSVLLADLQSDINLIIDPEAAKIAFSAPWKNITFAGNVANQEFFTQDDLDELIKVPGPYTQLVHDYYEIFLPLWDETAAAIMLDPSSGFVKNSTEFYVDVDTSYASPMYGNIRAYQKALAPRAQDLRKVNYVLEVDGAELKRRVIEAIQYPPTCADL
ncbi:nucleoside hydrolase [Polychaeton citri CBS 116435]|uniref:Nucleoside hydrolase n=1 Tax=Polychaeton citri CBS 116435 TaxID=1314669 RepID=A0A9P4UTW1_9PEZI|nr:nucleoside hydrolase [Polychaeton citri CBS 116435]